MYGVVIAWARDRARCRRGAEEKIVEQSAELQTLPEIGRQNRDNSAHDLARTTQTPHDMTPNRAQPSSLCGVADARTAL